MRLRRVPQTPHALREEPNRPRADSVTVRPYAALGETRYLVELHAGPRLLSDRPFQLYADAKAFAELESKWHGAKLRDLATRG